MATLATLKSFIKKNRSQLLINVKSDFDGMTDCIQTLKGGFVAATDDNTQSKSSQHHEATLGINGVWLVRGSRDYISLYEDACYSGLEVSNCCGKFIVAIKK